MIRLQSVADSEQRTKTRTGEELDQRHRDAIVIRPFIPNDAGGRMRYGVPRRSTTPACLGLLFAHAASAGQPAVAPGTAKINPKDGLKYVWIPPGTFTMGCSPGDTACEPTEQAHAVTLTRGFWLGQTEVVQSA